MKGIELMKKQLVSMIKTTGSSWGVSKFSGVLLPAEKQQMTENYRRLKRSSYLRCLQVKSSVFVQKLIMEKKQKEKLETPSTVISPAHGPFCPGAAPNQIIKC